MTRGAKVTVMGARQFSGVVLAASADTLVIQLAPGVSTTLFRDCASTKPLQWQLAGLPVEVREEINLDLFRERLRSLERRTRKLR